jgi:hypothetical protein
MKIQRTLEIEFMAVLHAGQEEYGPYRNMSKKQFVYKQERGMYKLVA